jgi:hypothetical protein
MISSEPLAGSQPMPGQYSIEESHKFNLYHVGMPTRQAVKICGELQWQVGRWWQPGALYSANETSTLKPHSVKVVKDKIRRRLRRSAALAHCLS